MLTDRGIPPCIIRVLLELYMIRVAWNGILLDYFLAVNEVKQGGVLRPMIFSVYIDGLSVRLMKARVGCHIGSHYVGVLAYADDIVLLAPSPAAMRQMLQILLSLLLLQNLYSAQIQASSSQRRCVISMLMNTVLCSMKVSLNV